MSKLDSITAVQAAEKAAKEKLEKANAYRESAILEAQSQASLAVSEATERAKAIKAEAAAKTQERMLREAKKSAAEQKKLISRTRNTVLSREKARKLARQIAKSIIGA